VIKNRIESFAKYAGIATVSVEWLALLLYYLQMPSYFGGKYPISYYATLPQTQLIFNICYTLAGIFFWIFIRHHLHRLYGAPIKIFALSMILFVCLAVVPFNPDNPISNNLHSILGWSSALFFIAGMYTLAKNAKNKMIYRVSMIAILVSTMLILAFRFFPKDSNLIFTFEAGSWLVWQIWTLWISYYSYRHHLVKK
jgi:hypothetical protein